MKKQGLANAQMALFIRKTTSIHLVRFLLCSSNSQSLLRFGGDDRKRSLASDSVLGLNLNAQLGASMMSNWFSSSWWTAAGLFLLMAGRSIHRHKNYAMADKGNGLKKDVVKTTVNPAADKQQSQMKMMTWFMFIMILVMSWSLPAAMGIYWLVRGTYFNRSSSDHTRCPRKKED